jgi:hypothetical protein
MPDKPRSGGSRDETRNTISMTRHELMGLLEDTAIKHSLKPQPTEASMPSEITIVEKSK